MSRSLPVEHDGLIGARMAQSITSDWMGTIKKGSKDSYTDK